MNLRSAKRNTKIKSPPSSTPASLRHSSIASNNKKYESLCLSKICDADMSMKNAIANCSPVAHRLRINDFRISPLEKNNRNTNSESSPDMSTSIEELSNRISLRKTPLSDHLQHSLCYAKQMEARAVHLSNRINTSANLSMSPRHLFSSDLPSPKMDEVANEHRRRSILVDDMNMQTFFSISRQTTSNIDRMLRYTKVCPEVVHNPTSNRFLSHADASKNNDLSLKVLNPIFNSSCLLGVFTFPEELSRTPLAILYRCKHRLSGVVYCLKRSRCEFEIERSHGSTISEIFNEVQALTLLHHSNILRYYFSWFETDLIFLQLEYCLGGSLFNYLHPNCTLDTSESVSTGTHQLKYPTVAVEHNGNYHSKDCCSRSLSETGLIVLMKHIIGALNYMHNNWSMVHGDIKPSNILLQLEKPEKYLASSKVGIEEQAKKECYRLLQSPEVSGVVFKLADFGRSSRAGEDRDGENLGDGRYLPRLNDPSSPARAAMGRDVYALGITLYHAAGGSMSLSVWEGLRENNDLPDLSILPVSLQPVVKVMLSPLAEDRPTTTDLINLQLLRSHLNSRHADSQNGLHGMDFD